MCLKSAEITKNCISRIIIVFNFFLFKARLFKVNNFLEISRLVKLKKVYIYMRDILLIF